MHPITASENTSSYHGHRSRLRKRFNRVKLDGMQGYEILELLLGFAIARIDTKGLAKELIKSFGSLAGVFDASQQELEKVPGIGPRSSLLITLMKEVSSAYLMDRIKKKGVFHNRKEMIDYCRTKFSGNKNEVVHVLFINTKGSIIDEKTLFQGSIDQSPVYPRRIIEEALDRHASGFILIHNHPSGDTNPSIDDIKLSQRIEEAAKLLDLRFLDHIIVGGNSYYSFKESGYFCEN